MTGTLTYREHATLSSHARALVVLVEGSGRPTAGTVVASQKLLQTGQIPIAFSVPYAGSDLHGETTYTLLATIIDADRVWVTGRGIPVITKGHPSSDIPLELTLRTDLLKGDVTGAISGVDVAPLSPQAFSTAILIDVDADLTLGIDTELEPVGVPIAFVVPFNPTAVTAETNYVVTGTIVDGASRWENPAGIPVITKGNAIAGVTVPVTAVQPPAPAEGGIGLVGAIVAIVGLLALLGAGVAFLRSR